MHTKWSVSGSELTPVEVDSLQDRVLEGVHRINFNPIDGFTLTRMDDAFVFNHKIYGIERKFIDHVKKTFKHTTANLGILLNGMKGGGKSLTCKMLANELGLPVLLVEQNFGVGLVKFISRFQQDVLVFVDEYEKVYSNGDSNNDDEDDETEKDATLLTLMDGVLNTEHRRVFMLTTNKLSVNANLLQRPGRIRYLKEFGNLPRTTIEEIVDDMLVHKHLRDVTVRFIAQLELITIDIVTSMVSEVNIHECDLEEIADILNVKKNPAKYDFVHISKPDKAGKQKETAVAYNVELNQLLEDYNIGDYLSSSRRHFGQIVEKTDDVYVISLHAGHGFKITTKANENVTLRIEQVPSYHNSFENAF